MRQVVSHGPISYIYYRDNLSVQLQRLWRTYSLHALITHRHKTTTVVLDPTLEQKAVDMFLCPLTLLHHLYVCATCVTVVTTWETVITLKPASERQSYFCFDVSFTILETLRCSICFSISVVLHQCSVFWGGSHNWTRKSNEHFYCVLQYEWNDCVPDSVHFCRSTATLKMINEKKQACIIRISLCYPRVDIHIVS